jgi:hypothetical protein
MGFQVKHMTNDLWERIDLDSTVKDYEFTRRAFSDIHRVVYSSDFEDMDADMIFSYLQGKMQLISFRRIIIRRSDLILPCPNGTVRCCHSRGSSPETVCSR